MPIHVDQPLRYKSYVSRTFGNGLPSGGGESALAFRINLKNGKEASVVVYFHSSWFSESRGYGGSSKTGQFTVTNPDSISMIRELIRTGDTTNLRALIDQLQEVEGDLATRVARWWKYASAVSASALLDQERRDDAFARKELKVGDVVGRSHYYSTLYTIVGERFEWSPYLGGGWRYTIPGYSGFRHHYWIPTEEQKATLPRSN